MHMCGGLRSAFRWSLRGVNHRRVGGVGGLRGGGGTHTHTHTHTHISQIFHPNGNAGCHTLAASANPLVQSVIAHTLGHTQTHTHTHTRTPQCYNNTLHNRNTHTHTHTHTHHSVIT